MEKWNKNSGGEQTKNLAVGRYIFVSLMEALENLTSPAK